MRLSASLRVVVVALCVPAGAELRAEAAPALDWSARFRPASRDGQPLAVPYTLIVDYRVLNCPAATRDKPAAPG